MQMVLKDGRMNQCRGLDKVGGLVHAAIDWPRIGHGQPMSDSMCQYVSLRANVEGICVRRVNNASGKDKIYLTLRPSLTDPFIPSFPSSPSMARIKAATLLSSAGARMHCVTICVRIE